MNEQSERQKPGVNDDAAHTYSPKTMPKLTKAELTEKIKANTGLSSYKADKGLKAALFCIKRALGDGKEVDLGKVGRLKVVERKRRRLIRRNLRGKYRQSIVELHKKYPRSLKLVGTQDVSENPLHVIVSPKERTEPDSIPARFRHIAGAIKIAQPKFQHSIFLRTRRRT